MDLKSAVEQKDWPAVEAIRERFREESNKSEPQRNLLSDLSKEALQYELKYLPALHRDFLQKLPAENRAVLILVGKRESPVLISLAVLKPQLAVLLHTAETRKQAENIKASGTTDGELKTAEIDPLQIDKTYEQLVDIVKQHRTFNWFCDITGGKKVMGACLGAFGFWRRIPVVYLDSKEVYGVPEPFSERLYLMKNPYDCYGDPLLEAAQKALEGYYFSSAEIALQSLLDTTSLQEQHHKTETALKIVQAYHQWDCFVHSDPEDDKAQKFYRDFQNNLNLYFRLGHQFLDSKTAEKNQSFVQKLKDTYEAGKLSLSDPCRLADVLRNAERRAVQEAFDDAVARLYRCVEMAATLILSKLDPEFNPDTADWQALQSRYPEIDGLYRQKAKKSLGVDEGLPRHLNRVGLAVQITLAAALGEAVSKNAEQNTAQLAENAKQIYEIYSNMKNKNHLFELRNRSILAHGSRPVGKQTFDKFRDRTMQICRLAVGDEWQELYDAAVFPEMRLTE